MREDILTLALAMTGGEGEETLETLCAAAEEYWLRRLRPGLGAEDCGGVFPCAAAMTAAADLAAIRQAAGPASFSAGDVSVRERTAAESGTLASCLRRSAERLMAPYAASGDLFFQEVRG